MAFLLNVIASKRVLLLKHLFFNAQFNDIDSEWLITLDFNNFRGNFTCSKNKSPLKSPKCNCGEKRCLIRIFHISFHHLCQAEGHGGTLSKFSLKFLKNFSRQIWKIFYSLLCLCGRYSHGTWILDRHPSV